MSINKHTERSQRRKERGRASEGRQPEPETVGTGPGAWHNVREERTGHQHGTPGEPELASPKRSGPRHDVARGRQTEERPEEHLDAEGPRSEKEGES